MNLNWFNLFLIAGLLISMGDSELKLSSATALAEQLRGAPCKAFNNRVLAVLSICSRTTPPSVALKNAAVLLKLFNCMGAYAFGERCKSGWVWLKGLPRIVTAWFLDFISCCDLLLSCHAEKLQSEKDIKMPRAAVCHEENPLGLLLLVVQHPSFGQSVPVCITPSQAPENNHEMCFCRIVMSRNRPWWNPESIALTACDMQGLVISQVHQ